MKTIIEPFRIKSVEPLRHTTREERERLLEAAGYNLFLIEARDILIDLLTDSGTSAMSTGQWAALMRGDESYAGSESFFRLKRVADELTGFRHMIPTHQGRAAERILFTVMCKPGHVVPTNTHFDTTRANIEFTGARAVDLPIPEAADTQARLDFKGNMDVAALEAADRGDGAEHIPLVMLTVTNNSGGGQPVSMANIEAVRRVSPALRHSASTWTPAGSPKTPGSSASASRATPSGRRNESRRKCFRWRTAARSPRRKTRSPTSAAFSRTNDDRLAAAGDQPADPDRRLSHLRRPGRARPGSHRGGPGRGARPRVSALPHRLHRLPGAAHRRSRRAHRGAARRACHLYRCRAHAAAHSARAVSRAGAGRELYRHAGIRAVEIGSVMFGDRAQHELLRLAIPRRVYTQSHIDYVVEAILEVNARKEEIRGLEIADEPPFLRHFSARFRQLAPVAAERR